MRDKFINHVCISSLGSITGLVVPFFTGKLVDKFSFTNFNWNFLIAFVGIFILNALLSGIGLYLLSKIGEKIIYAIRSLLWLKFVNENLSTSLPVKNGTTSPVILPKDDIHTAITINPTGHVNFLNK